MKNFLKKGIVAFISVAAIATGASAVSRHSVTDMAGRVVSVADDPRHGICLAGPSYEKALMLGQRERVAGIHASALTPWAKLVNPRLVEIPVVRNPQTPNLEELMNLQADFVLFWKLDDQMEKMARVGIPSIVVQFPGALPYDDCAGFIEYQKKEVLAIAQAFGGSALERADRWIRYFDDKIAYVTARTSKLAPSELPRVYYARSDQGLVTFSRNSYPQYLVEMAGGVYVSKDTPVEMNSKVTLEQIINWDPDVIFMGRMKSVDIIMENPAWSGIKAVKEKKVYLCPSGIKDWDYSSENVLLLLYLAKTLHPDLFQDLDMEREVRDYFRIFYDFELSDENVRRVLTHRDPAAQ